MHHKFSLGTYKVDRMRSLRKILTRHCGTNFCTSSACFALSFVRLPNGPKCTQIVRNTPKCQFSVQSGAFVSKKSDAASWHALQNSMQNGQNFCTSSAHFVPSFVRQPNGPKCAQIIRNVPKHQFRFL